MILKLVIIIIIIIIIIIASSPFLTYIFDKRVKS